MASGLARQLGFCSPDSTTNVDTNPAPSPAPSWCSDAAFVQSLRDAQTRLWTSIRGAKSGQQTLALSEHSSTCSRGLFLVPAEIYSEVWSYTFDNATNAFSVADLASLSPFGTESDAIQLWSYGFLGLLDPSENSTRS